ncbi:ABC transporter substrate-binding protein [Natronosporangium hydrolyticum]|uniref:ABC transporter substrate-binding protein n=1 Tax=Natronosporangium hydrolyticum TaxID=2811111 RepID=A0A895Y6D8_9ACTN|nr:ABC transporter substrate-binding protein [Natronosporangium hydrolyticum]QSB12931.1 ABC transporter substrate-binding protein [Natronosporangium hydrolyticum]
MNPPLPVSPRARWSAGRTRTRAVAAATAVALLATTACNGGEGDDAQEAPQTGGTLYVDVLALPNYLDPQLVQTGVEANISNLLGRTLTGYRSAPGAAGSELVPDLATDTGRPSENNTVWEFTLREGVRWEDGEPVTCQHVKYGVERRFSELSDRQTGAVYPLTYLRDNEPAGDDEPEGRVYRGPWVDNNNDGAGLESIECVDQRVIRFHLVQPRSDFNYTVSLPVFGAVPPGADDDRDGYNEQPLSNGPYQIASHEPGEQLVLERNPHWDAATDPQRGAYPDQLVIEALGDAAVATNDLVNDAGGDRSRVMLDMDVAPTFLQQVMTDPVLATRVATGPRGAVRYLAVNTALVADERCRQALSYAMNKRKLRSVFGGSLLGDLATTMIPPNLLAHQEFDHYDTIGQPDGQPDRAAELREQAAADGADCPDEITFAFPDNAELRRMANVVVESYQRIGVQVALEPIDLQEYFVQVLGERRGEFHLTWIVWTPDWPNGSSVIPPLFDGREPTYNLSQLNDDQIHDLIDEAFAEPDPERQYRLWGELDSLVLETGAAIPLMYSDALRMYGSNVRGVFIHPMAGMPDLASIGLADPALSEASDG